MHVLGKEPVTPMRLQRIPGLAIPLSAAVLLGAAAITSAAPGQKKKPAPASAALAAAGKKVYEANGCAACHVVAGRGGKTGPDLSHIAANKKNTAARLGAVIRDPKKALNTEKMPAYPADKIKDADLKALVAYLGSLK